LPILMIAVVIGLIAALRSTVRSRAELATEVFALRHQLAVLRRQGPRRLRLRRADRLLWAVLSRAWSEWRHAVWWLRLGIQIECIKPGHPEQNGRHERMHLSLNTEATKPAAANVLQPQARFETFRNHYNHERPHEALAMKVPAEVYTASRRPYRGLSEVAYPLDDWTTTVTRCGRTCWKRRKISFSTVFAGQNVGVRQVSDRIWLVEP
jgi:hypothetical protein